MLTWWVVGTACDSVLDTKSDSLLPKDKLQTEDGCEALLIGAYDLMQSTAYYGRDVITVPDVLADNSRLSPLASRYKGQADNRTGSLLAIVPDSFGISASLNECIEYP